MTKYEIRGYDAMKQAHIIYQLRGVTPVCSYNGYIRGNVVTMYPRAVFEPGVKIDKLVISIFDLKRER